MLPAQPSCCRAVKRRLRAPSDAIWITDATLGWAFDRLCVISRPSRRNGTSVPGPLECRRRAGKRRMAHYAEAARPPPADFGALWGLGRKTDHTKWQWEAPSATTAPRQGDAKPLLPTWLTEFEAPEDLDAESSISEPTESLRHVEQFCDSLRQETRPHAIKDLCTDFNIRFKQSIRLGQVPNDVLTTSTRDIPNYIRQRASEGRLADDMCLEFLRAVWDGVTESKVLGPADVGTGTLHWLFVRLQQLPLQDCAPLFTEVLDSINCEQTAELKQPLFSLANSTLGSALRDSAFAAQMSKLPLGMNLASLDNGEMLNVDFMEGFVQSLGAALSTYPTRKACDHVRDLARMSTSYVALSIHRHCNSVSQQIKSGATGIDPQWARIRDIRKSWVKSIARLPYANEALLAEACRIMEAGDPSSDVVVKSNLAISDICDIMLEFWSLGLNGASMPDVKAIFQAAANKAGSKKGSKGAIVHFCKALELHSKLWRKRTEDLLRIIREIRGSSLTSFYCLRDLEKAQICLRASTLRKELDALARDHPSEAMLLFKIYSARQRDPLGLEDFPELANSLLQEGNSEELWLAMGGDKMWQEQSISDSRIRLVYKIAFHFAQTDSVTARVALRNITRCYHYLSYHKVPMTATISQLITKVGLERRLLEKGGVSEGHLNWVLGIVCKVEGARKADLMEEVLARRQEMVDRQHRDPLGRGPIG